ncbi:MAG: glycosyltransferase family 4 protein [Bryobacteraceae bacterium]
MAYLSFDAVPAPKGAATHIEAFARLLGEAFGGLDLVTVSAGPEAIPPVERWPGVTHTALPATGPSLIDRVLCFRRGLESWLASRRFQAIQFRSIFEGLPLLRLKPAPKLIFEVNGLPSIELKYHYTGAADDRELNRKLLSQEQACLNAASLVVTPSGVTANYLASQRAVAPGKVVVIPNGVDLSVFRFQPPARSNGCFHLLYFGTLAPWQGVDLTIRALAQISQHAPAALTIIGAGSNRKTGALRDLAAKLGVGNRLQVLPPMSQPELLEQLRQSDATLAPLGLNDRNVVQGCCPLKILEGMAAGTPVIASDLPVVRELGRDGEHFLLVKPGSVDQLAEAALRLRSDPQLSSRLALQARAQIEAAHTWERAGAALLVAYDQLGISRSSSA